MNGRLDKQRERFGNEWMAQKNGLVAKSMKPLEKVSRASYEGEKRKQEGLLHIRVCSAILRFARRAGMRVR